MSDDALRGKEDDSWAELAGQWKLPAGVTCLNHGSFGSSPRPVVAAQEDWQAKLEANRMDFFIRQYEPSWLAARDRVASFLGSANENLVFVENATAGMNDIANSFPLAKGEEVLLTDHVYGAVRRVWERAANRVEAHVRSVTLPLPVETQQAIVDTVIASLTPRTRLLVISHITSATAVVMPIAAIAREAQSRGVAICVDGPHAIAQLPLQLDELGCDFYTASCHKWLCAPSGSGVLHVHPKWHTQMQPAQLSWGRVMPTLPERWADEFVWTGTRNPSSYFSVPAAIDFLESIGLEKFRQRSHELAQYARQELCQLLGTAPVVPDDPTFYAGMTLHPLPPGDHQQLQATLCEQFQIQVPIITWNEATYIRVSCHLYNNQQDIHTLLNALKELL